MKDVFTRWCRICYPHGKTAEMLVKSWGYCAGRVPIGGNNLSETTGNAVSKISLRLWLIAALIAGFFSAADVFADNHRPNCRVVRSGSHSARPQQVYLLRGLFNVFSLGMDDLGRQLRDAGVAANVVAHTSCLLYTSPSPRDRS